MSGATDWVYLPADESGVSYYYANLSTGETQWERPAALGGEASGSGAASAAAAASATPSAGRRASVQKVQKAAKALAAAARWVEYMDETHGRPYFYNEDTGESAWFVPADEDEDDEDDAEEGEEEEATAAAGAEAEAAAEAEKAKAKAEKRAARRLKILEEIVSTEQSYVDALRVINKVFVDPLRMVADVPKGAIFSHEDLNSIFLNITVITKVNENFLAELKEEEQKWPHVNYAPTLRKAAQKFKGCYTRFVNNFDTAAAKLVAIAASDKQADKDKQRYLVGSAKHPDAKGRDLRSFLIQPVQRVPRYRMLLEDLLNHTDEGGAHSEERADIQEALEMTITLAKSFNEDKRVVDDHAQLLQYFDKFVDKARGAPASLSPSAHPGSPLALSPRHLHPLRCSLLASRTRRCCGPSSTRTIASSSSKAAWSRRGSRTVRSVSYSSSPTFYSMPRARSRASSSR